MVGLSIAQIIPNFCNYCSVFPIISRLSEVFVRAQDISQPFQQSLFLRNGFAKTSKSFFSFSWNATEPLPLEGANRTKIGTPMAAGF